MKTELSKSINPLEIGRITEDELLQLDELLQRDYLSESFIKGHSCGMMDALSKVVNLPFVKLKLTANEQLEILNLYKK